MSNARNEGQDVNLTGVWQGLYSYETIDEPVPFLATLIDTGNFISGTTQETCAVEMRPKATPCAMIDGARRALHVSFTKKYDGSDGWEHVVVYDGSVSSDGKEIDGRWILPEGITGHFLMVREGGKAQEIWVKKFVDIEA